MKKPSENQRANFQRDKILVKKIYTVRKVSIVPFSYMMYSPSRMNTKGTMIRSYFSIVSNSNGIEDKTRLISHKIIMPITNTSKATRVCDQSNEAK